MRKLVWLFCAGLSAAAASDTGALEILRVNVSLVTNDFAKETEFYGDVVGLKPISSDTNANGVHRARFQAGTGMLEVLAPPVEVPRFKDDVEGAVGIRAVALFLAEPEQFSRRLKAHGYPEAQFLAPNPGMKVARVKDPDGNFVELIFPGDATPAKLNHIAVALRMPDVERSKEFYGKTLGLKVLPPHGDPKNLSYGFALGDSSLFVKRIPEGMPNRGGAPTDAVGYRAVTLMVNDVSAAERFLKGRGVKIVQPVQGEKARSLTAADPDGIYLIFASAP